MKIPKVIIVNGLPCSGKTTIANNLADYFKFPVVGKDTFKELLFDTLGWEDREWSKKLDVPSMELLYKFIEIEFNAEKTCIVENPFDPIKDGERFIKLKQKYNYIPIQILCFAQGDVLVKRFKDRAEAGNRHPGHQDHLTYEEHYPILIQEKIIPMDIGGVLQEINTTNFSLVEYDLVYSKVLEILER
jgi:adenylate kinase family enzyme